MKKAPPVRLSLRKLFIAMLAVGPMAILPSPVMAAVPASTPFTVTSGSATWNAAGNTGTINAGNRSVLTWGSTVQGDTTTLTNFHIAAGETFNFVLPSGGAVLNRVTAGSNTVAAGVAAGAIINGTLLSNGQVFVLSNGNIVVGTGAQISTASGLILSTLAENDFNFTANGNLALNGASQGNITLGTGTGVANVIGNLAAYAGGVTANNITVSGDLIINQTGSGTALTLTTTHPTTVGGNFTATSNNGAIGQGTGALIVANGHTQLTAGANTITLATATNDFKTLGINTTGTTTGNVSIVEANIVTLAASSIGQDLILNAGGTGGNTAISTNGTVAVGGNATFIQNTTGNSAINIGNNSTVAGWMSFNASNSTVTFNGLGNITLGNGSNVGANVSAGVNSTLTITTNGVLNIGNTIDVTGNGTDRAGITLTAASINQTANITSTAGNGTISLNATSGNITLGNITNSGTGGVSLRTAGGSISQNSGAIITTANNSQTSTINAGTGTVNLTNANAFIGTGSGSILQITAGSATINNTGATGTLRIGTANVTGNLTINNDAGNNSVVLGVGTGTGAQNLTVGGNLTVLTAGTGTITDGDYSAFNIAGGLNLTTGAGGSVTLDAAVANGSLAPNVQLGQVKISTGGAAAVAERTTLNLGNITAASLNATSVTGGIINSGDLNITGTANFTTSGASTSVITNGTNTIGTVNFIGSGGELTVGSGGVTLGAATNVTAGDDVILNSTNGGAIVLDGATIGGSLTVNSSNTINTGTGNTSVGGSLSLMAANTGATSVTQSGGGRFIVTGVTNVASAGNVALTQGNDFIGGVVLNQAASAGNVEIYDLNNLNISGTAGGFVDARAGATALSIDNAWNVVLGNLSAGSLTATAINGGGGNSGTISQASGSAIHIEGAFRAVTNNANIVLTNNGNSAGRVEFFTNGATNNGSGTISYTEDGTIRVGNLASNSNITLRSNFGSIIEDTNASATINARATLNATAPNGNILLGGTTNTTTTTTANVATFIASAPSGSVAILSNNSITLGSINANSLAVTATNNISQSAALNIFGTANFTSTATADPRNITLTNSTNNFGPLSLQIGNNTGTISITEANTLNLRRVTMLGGGNSTFTANSVNGDIIDTGFDGVRLGGNATATGSGIVSLVATNGNIEINNPQSDIASTSGVVFNAKEVTFSVLGNASTSLVLGGASGPSVATGNLTVTNLLGSIGNAGAMTAGGTATFTTPSGNIVIGQPGVGFGIVKFNGQQVQISEAGNMDIATGSSATGPAVLNSGGSISITNVGGGNVTFTNTVNLTASGNITPGSLLQAGGQLRISHTGTADLSGLSLSSNLNGIAPIDAGTGPGPATDATLYGPKP